MAASLYNLYTNVESVAPDATDPAGTVLLGISIAVQPTSPRTGTPQIAQPWTWKWQKAPVGGGPVPPAAQDEVSWVVVGRRASSTKWTLVTEPLELVPVPDVSSDWTAVTDAIKKQIDSASVIYAASSVQTNPTDARTIQIDNTSFGAGSTKDTLTYGQKYLSLLMNLAAAPYPIPDLLRLTHFVKFKGLNPDPAAPNPAGTQPYVEFLALPKIGNTPYDPSSSTIGLPPDNPSAPASVAVPPASWGPAQMTDLTMYSEFSYPGMGSLFTDQSPLPTGQPQLPPDVTLWFPKASDTGANPLVSNWQAHLFELLGPYLDVAHVLTSTVYEPSLKGVVDTSTKLFAFRSCVLRALYTLVSALIVTAVPSSDIPTYSGDDWVGDLEKVLAEFSSVLTAFRAGLPAPEAPVSAGEFASAIADLRRIVVTACTGTNLLSLITLLNATVPAKYSSAIAVPDNYRSAAQAPALLSLLQSRLAVPQASAIAAACKPAPGSNVHDMLSATAANLLNNVITPVYQIDPSLISAIANAVFSPPPPPANSPPPPNLGKSFTEDLFKLALGKTATGPVALTANPSPLVLPVISSPSTEIAAPASSTAADPLRGIRGVGVLLKRIATNAVGSIGTGWTCPCIVSPVITVLDATTQTPTDVPHTNLPVFVASRLIYDRGMLTGLLLYNNGPLACANLLHEYMNVADRLSHLGAGDPAKAAALDQTNLPASVLSYASYEGGVAGSLAKGTAGLLAGSTYEFVAFAVSNSGALPRQLRDAYPSRFKLPNILTDDHGTPADFSAAHVSSTVYYRTVPVAGLSTCEPDGTPIKNTADFFPAIPANVWPRATDTKTKPSGVGIGITNAAAAPDEPWPHLPLVLLAAPAPGKALASRTSSSFKFSVRLPAVDPQTWLITKGYSDPNAAAVMDWAYGLQKDQQHAPITDPLLVDGDTCVDFTLYSWDGTKWTGGSVPVPFTRTQLNQATTGALSVQTLPIVIDIDSVAGTVKLTPLNQSGSVIPSKLQEGGVYLLEARLYLQLQDQGVVKMPGYAQGTNSDPNKGCIAGYQLLIEVASAKMPTDLMTPLKINLLPLSGLPDQQVQFQVVPPAPANPNAPLPLTDPKDIEAAAWQNVHRVDFLRQMWSWTGRTQPDMNDKSGDLLKPMFYPTASPLTDPEAAAWSLSDPILKAWELIEFAERPPADQIEALSAHKPKTLALPAIPATPAVPATPTAPAISAVPAVPAVPATQERYEFTLDLSQDPRATYIRVAPRIYSRYQGMYASTSWSVVSTIDGGTWARTFVRSRARSLKMPRLKALLPLTESAFPGFGTPGILAVFDGPAYDQAGLAERLCVDFATVTDPQDETAKWAQTGPDLLAGPPLQVVSASQQTVLPKLICVGPIGHTDDPLSGLEHKFLSHSYIIRPNQTAAADKIQDFSWWFAELSFKLTADIPSTVFSNSTKPVQSEQVVGSWIQFLPGFQTTGRNADMFDNWSFKVDDTQIAANGTGPNGIKDDDPIVRFTLYDEAKKVPQTPGVEAQHLTHHYLMVNQMVLDIAGVERQDYFGIAVLSAKNDYVLLPGRTWVTGTKVTLRVIELRAGTLPDPGNIKHHADFWKYVAAEDTTYNDKQRMTSVNLSAPIRQGEW